MSVETNSNGVNKAITYNILSDEEMRRVGFSDHCKKYWVFSRMIKFPKVKKYKDFEISFMVTIPKDGGELRIDVLDDDFGQPYDYQRMLSKNPPFEPALIVKEQVEKFMLYLHVHRVLKGHIFGEYI